MVLWNLQAQRLWGEGKQSRSGLAAKLPLTIL